MSFYYLSLLLVIVFILTNIRVIQSSAQRAQVLKCSRASFQLQQIQIYPQILLQQVNQSDTQTHLQGFKALNVIQPLKRNLISNCCSVIDQIDVYEGNEEGQSQGQEHVIKCLKDGILITPQKDLNCYNFNFNFVLILIVFIFQLSNQLKDHIIKIQVQGLFQHRYQNILIYLLPFSFLSLSKCKAQNIEQTVLKSRIDNIMKI
ncbi:hypothetical protein pb186bvf_014289 [Paramecium bursaria]